MGSHEAQTAQTVPPGRLMPGKTYLVRIDASDHKDWPTYNARSDSKMALLRPEVGNPSGITGVVRDSTGAPLSNIHVYAHANDSYGPWVGGTFTDALGRYTLFLNPGTYIVRAYPSHDDLFFTDKWYWNEYNSHDAAQIRVSSDQFTSGIDFALNAAGKIKGHTYQSDGATPVADMHVYATDYTTGQWMAGVNTGSDGGYTLTLPAGAYRISTCATCTGLSFMDAYYDKSDHSAATAVYVTTGSVIREIDFALEAILFPSTRGDIDGNRTIDLVDAILALQIAAGLNPSGIHLAAEVDGSGRIGLSEAIYILQTLGHMRQP